MFKLKSVLLHTNYDHLLLIPRILANTPINIIISKYNIPIRLRFLVIMLNNKNIIIHIPLYFNPSIYPF